MKANVILILGLCACCFAEEKGLGDDGTGESSSDGSATSTSSSGDDTSGGESDSESNGESTSEAGAASESSSTGEASTGEPPRFCAFSGAPCESDGDCGIPGVCYSGTQSCFHKCATNLDCPDPAMVCFVSGFGSYCSGCPSACAGGATCENGLDCAEEMHAECTTSGTACLISDSCVR